MISEVIVPNIGCDLEEVLRMIDLGSTDPNLECEFLSSLGSSWTGVSDPSETSLVDPGPIILNIITISFKGAELNVKEMNHVPGEFNPLGAAASELSLLSITPA